MRKCQETGDYAPVLFEWYKFVGSLNAVVAHVQHDSPAFRDMPKLHYYVLIGLLNRCARLMLSNVALSHEGQFGETTAIVDRCIFESAVKITWLCIDPSPDKFTRFLADGLRTEVEFKATIDANITSRKGDALPIETRMLASIDNHIKSAGLTESTVLDAKKLPDMAGLLSAIGFNRLMYVVGQRLGSHHVHGTWSSLLFHYLEESPAGSREFVPRGHECATHVNQFVFVPKMVLGAMSAYVRYAFNESDASLLEGLFDSVAEEIDELYITAAGGSLGN